MTEKNQSGESVLDYSNPFEPIYQKLRPYVNSAADEVYDIPMTSPYMKQLRKTQVQRCTEKIAYTWSQVLRWACDKNNDKPVELSDCLMPDDSEWAWDKKLNQTGFSSEQIEDILRKLGQNELPIELPWGGYVAKIEDNYELIKIDQDKMNPWYKKALNWLSEHLN